MPSGNGRNTPPRKPNSVDAIPSKASGSDGGDDEDMNEFARSAFSVIKRQPGDGDDEPSGDDQNENRGRDNTQDEDDKPRDDSMEFQLVKSRNIEIVNLAGSMGCRITYIDSNDSLRNYIVIKGRDGEAFNQLLISAERRDDEPTINELL